MRAQIVAVGIDFGGRREGDPEVGAEGEMRSRALRRDRLGDCVLGEEGGDAAVDGGGARLFVPLLVGQRGDGEVERFAE